MALKKEPRMPTTEDARQGSAGPEAGAPASGEAGGAPKAGEILRIRSQSDGYRRAGRAWSRLVQEVPAAELTAAQIAALEADPRITVQRVA